MNFAHRYPLNVPGKFYVTGECTDCDLCRECAPDNIQRDDRHGYSYFYKQPQTEEEMAAVLLGVEGCPTGAVRQDGDTYDWEKEPIINWNSLLNAEFDLGPLISQADSIERYSGTDSHAPEKKSP
ncbi:MAG: hypothetical protein CMO55_12455 [Verrucomicrobiales bacterium]|nr:hypothetical protein [Verrucomicrobiales bacterium]